MWTAIAAILGSIVTVAVEKWRNRRLIKEVAELRIANEQLKKNYEILKQQMSNDITDPHDARRLQRNNGGN